MRWGGATTTSGTKAAFTPKMCACCANPKVDAPFHFGFQPPLDQFLRPGPKHATLHAPRVRTTAFKCARRVWCACAITPTSRLECIEIGSFSKKHANVDVNVALFPDYLL